MRSTQSNERRLVHFSGRVQGVGFRYRTHAIARDHNVYGYVRNLPDGRVQLVVEGRRPEIDAFLREVRDRFSGHIRDESADVQPATGEFTDFRIQH